MKIAAGAFGALLLMAGCVARAGRGTPAALGVPGPQPPTDQARRPASARPTTPLQFAEVAESAWTITQPLVGRVRPCDHGKAVVFPCQNVDLLAFLPVKAIGGTNLVSDLWGWTDPVTRREFVIVGLPGLTSFVEITDPLNPRYLGTLLHSHDGSGGNPRDIKVYHNYAFIVGEGSTTHGMQVFDLTQLRDVPHAPATFQPTAVYDRIDNAHNIVIDTATGFAYTVQGSNGGETCGGGLHMIDIHEPRHPTFAGCYPETFGGTRASGAVHDAQCVVYRGPDQAYQGREICLDAAGEALGIVDVTDKHAPKLLGIGRYPDVGFTHQGWLSEDQRYFFVGDEYDEKSLALGSNGGIAIVNSGRKTRTLIFDLTDLTDPVLAKEYFAGTDAIDHNQYVRGHYLYQANYSAGLRILDVTDPRNPREVAYFDTDIYGRGQFLQFSGAWGNYPYFQERGLVAVTSMGDGLFILRHRMEQTRSP